MVDNVQMTPGTGVMIASDDVGGVQYQRVKLATGVDGVAQDVSHDNPLTVRTKCPHEGTITTIPCSMTSIELVPLNHDRLGARIYNTASTVLYIGCTNGNVSVTQFTGFITTNDFFDVPFDYCGAIQGMWAQYDPDGLAVITEFV